MPRRSLVRARPPYPVAYMEKGQKNHDSNVGNASQGHQSPAHSCSSVTSCTKGLALHQGSPPMCGEQEVGTSFCGSIPHIQGGEPSGNSTTVALFHENPPYVPGVPGQALRHVPAVSQFMTSFLSPGPRVKPLPRILLPISALMALTLFLFPYNCNLLIHWVC
ncbi:hypothetical protein XENORESO_017166 [Xenotaenia resolanae]|uniref:Uncharacterized protein n=1 Tax=Xenotaenia resolanae TaxID=208358 RepID=A0ABV0WMA2_9TELE